MPLLNARRVDLVDDKKLVAQLVGLERRTARSGKDPIDHAPNAHDDVANCVAGVAGLLATGSSYNDMDLVGAPASFAEQPYLSRLVLGGLQWP